MNIMPVKNYGCNQNISAQNSRVNPNFRGELSDKTVKRVFAMLQEKVTGTHNCSDIIGMKKILGDLASKWDKMGLANGSGGIMVIPDDELMKFLGDDAFKYNLKDLQGFCVAVGDKFGPIVSWNKVYEAKTVLLPKTLFK